MQRVIINGISAEHISVMDRGLHYGDGIFETIACVEGKLQFWDEHINRLKESANILNIECPASSIFLSDINSLHSDKCERYVVKILLTRGKGSRGYQAPAPAKSTRIVMINDWPDKVDFTNSACLCFCEHPISVNAKLSGIKHLNRLDNVLARSEWNDEFQEGLMSDINGNIIEGTMSNVFGIKNNDLYTPSLDYCGVNGVIRKQVIDIAKNMHIPVHISTITKEDLCSMNEIFITNSIIGIWPVSRMRDKEINLGDQTAIFINELQKRSETNAKYIT